MYKLEQLYKQSCETPSDINEHCIWLVIEEFISDNPHWSIHERYVNNNGLTILKRN